MAHWHFYFILALWILSLRLSVACADELDLALGDAVRDALHLSGLSAKEAAAIMHTDEANFRNRLQGRNGLSLSLNHLARLPWEFWLHFTPTLIYLVTRRNLRHVAQDLGLTRSA